MALVIQHYSLGLQVPTPPCISRDYLVMTIIPWIHGPGVIGPGGLLHLCEYVHTKSEMITVMPHSTVVTYGRFWQNHVVTTPVSRSSHGDQD